MIRFNNVNIELIENFPCDNANDLICKKNEVIDTVINEIKKLYKKIIHIYLLTKQKKIFKYIFNVKKYNNLIIHLYIHVYYYIHVYLLLSIDSFI